MQYTAKIISTNILNRAMAVRIRWTMLNWIDLIKCNTQNLCSFFLFSSSNPSVKCVFLIHAFRRLTKCNPNATLLFLFQTDVSWICVLGWWFVVKWTFNQKTSIWYFNYSKRKNCKLVYQVYCYNCFWLNMSANKWIIN